MRTNKIINIRISKKLLSYLLTGIVAGSLVVAEVISNGCGISSVYAEEADEADETDEADGQTISYTYSDLIAGKNSGEAEIYELESYTTIEIATEEEWAEFAASCVSDSWSRDKYVKLVADIALKANAEVYVPTFGGIFDGNNHTIKNVNVCGAGSSYGLFRYVQVSGRIENLTVSGNVTADYSAEHIGMLVGENYGTVSGCRVVGEVSGTNEVGGVVGYNSATGTVIDCVSECTVTGTHSVGGIVGNNEGSVDNCENKGSINTAESDVTVDITEITVDSITTANSTSNIAAFTDVGGIAGISSGGVTDCTNFGRIGYEHVGYNIGGIVGRVSQGYVIACTNNGRVYGRKDVGGIAGQMEPFLQMEYMVDGVEQLNEEVNTLLDLMNKATNDLDYYGNKTSNLLGGMSDALLEANQITEELPNGEGDTSVEEMKSQIESVQDNLLTLAEDMEIIAGYSDELSDIIDNGNRELTSDLRAIINQATKISSLSASIRADVFSYGGIEFKDTSVEESDNYDDSEMSLNGKLSECYNYGTVEADTAVGGIVGRIATEYDANPEDDVNLTGDQSLYVSATAKAIVKACVNYAKINAKKDCAGGIAGFVKYGALMEDTSAGDVYSENGSYVGGIAGECNSNILECYSCCDVEGKSYVGGIVGKGLNVSDSIAFCNITFSGERAGAIAGMIDDGGVIGNNRYVGNAVAGIDGISYCAGAEEIDYASLKEISDLPVEFTDFQIVFLADGQEVRRISASYGDIISQKDIPDVPEKEGFFGMWPDYDYSFVSGSVVLEAVYEKWLGSVQSTQTVAIHDSVKPVLLVVGDFLPGAELKLTVNDTEYEYAIDYPEDYELAKTLGVSEYSGTVNVRVAVADTDKIEVETYVEGNWKVTEFEVIGSYISFDMEAPGRFRITEHTDYSKYIVIGGIVAVVVALVLLLALVNRARKIRRKMVLKRPPKAVIFDLDGTLIDTEKYYRRVWPQALEHFGYCPTDEQALELRSLGRPFAPKKLKEWFGEDFDYDAVRNYRKVLFEKCIEEEGVALKPGVKELLDELRAKNITIAIATATDVERTRKYLERVGIAEYFDKICSAANVKEGKPSPDVYIEACKQLKVMPEACFAVEDAPNGIKSAAAAGCRVIFVPDQTKEEPEAEKLIFAKVNTADEIIALLG